MKSDNGNDTMMNASFLTRSLSELAATMNVTDNETMITDETMISNEDILRERYFKWLMEGVLLTLVSVFGILSNCCG